MQDVSGMTSMTICKLWESKKQSVNKGEIEEISPLSIRLKSIGENYQDYKKSSLFLVTNYCDLKCCRENGKDVCHNSNLIKSKGIEVRYLEVFGMLFSNRPVLNAVVFGGLEPFEQMNEVYWCIKYLRQHWCEEDIVIYTGYLPEELNPVDMLKIVSLGDIIIKFGRFIPNHKEKYDETLGIVLASDNQFAVRF